MVHQINERSAPAPTPSGTQQDREPWEGDFSWLVQVLWVCLQQIEVGPVAEAVVRSIECRVHCFKNNCFLCKGWQDGGWGCFSLWVGTSKIAQSHTSKFVITATVELKFKGALSDSFHLAIYTVSKEKYFLYLIQTPVRHQSVWMWADVQMTNVWRNRRSWEKNENVFFTQRLAYLPWTQSQNLMNQKVKLLYRLISKQCYSLKIKGEKRNMRFRPFIEILSY